MSRQAGIYAFQNTHMSPQSGHIQVTALQDSPHMFSSIQAGQIWNPHRHVQQKGSSFPQA